MMTVSARVLVVDDEPDFLATYERLLRRQGYDVALATSCAEGIAAVVRERPRVVISDLRLPDGDGLAVIRAARELPSPPSVIVVTGHPSDQARRAALEAGATLFFAKPVAAAVLLAAIAKSLDGPARC